MIQRLILRSSLTPDQVVLRLRAVTMPADGFLWNWRHIFTWEGRRPPEFSGQIREGDFALQYLSPFWGATSRPLVMGLIVGTGAGTELRIRMRAVGPEWIRLGLLCLVIFLAMFEDGVSTPLVVVLALALAFVGASWVIGSRRARRVLERTILGRPERTHGAAGEPAR